MNPQSGYIILVFPRRRNTKKTAAAEISLFRVAFGRFRVTKRVADTSRKNTDNPVCYLTNTFTPPFFRHEA